MQFPTQYQPAMSSHYAQAYMNLSTTTTSTSSRNICFTPHAPLAQNATLGSVIEQNSGVGVNLHTFAPWYQPGNNKCTFKGCKFTASRKTLEVHLMDRHLIYPPGWEKRQKKSDWDADPSLKGKTIPIQGTTIVLDSPEVVEAWIAERKKRWPTNSRIESKKRKMEEAIARGQLPVGDSILQKKRRIDGSYSVVNKGKRSGSDRYRQGRRWDRVCEVDSDRRDNIAIPTPFPDMADSEPETMSTKNTLQDTQPLAAGISNADRSDHRRLSGQQISGHPNARKIGKAHVMQKEFHTPFVSRPTLLRNLLLPEIRITISNLSQAIRFLANNSFLQGVELRAGEGDEKRIEVVSKRAIS